jgi:hypothetical protein
MEQAQNLGYKRGRPAGAAAADADADADADAIGNA